MPSNVKDVDLGYDAFMRRMQKHMRGPNVTVGIQGTEAAQDRGFGETNVTIAAVHEFGSRDGKIPQRSFIRATIDRERELIRRMLGKAAVAVATGGNAYRAVGVVGEKVKSEMVKTIDRSIGLKPLADSTIEAKGSSRPLIDTSQLKNSITWKAHNV